MAAMLKERLRAGTVEAVGSATSALDLSNQLKRSLKHYLNTLPNAALLSYQTDLATAVQPLEEDLYADSWGSEKTLSSCN